VCGSEDVTQYNTIRNALTNAIALGRRKKRQELIESADMTHSSRRAWKTIRMLGNDYTKTETKPLVTADQVALQLLAEETVTISNEKTPSVHIRILHIYTAFHHD